MRRTLTGHSGSVVGVAFSADGYVLTTVAEDATARQWDLVNGKNLHTIHARAKVARTAAFSPDGSVVATASDDCAVDLWNCRTGEHHAVFQHTRPVRAVTFSPDGQLLATGSDDGRVRLRDLATGDDLIILKDQTAAVRAVAFRPDGRLIAIGGGQDGRVWLCDPTNGKLLRVLKRPMGFLEGLQGSVNVITFSPDGRFLATGSEDKKARLWSPATGRHLRDLRSQTGFHLGKVYAAVFRPDGRILATGGGTVVWLWNPATGENLDTLSVDDSNDVITMAFSPDGHFLVTTDRRSGAIRLWG